MLQFEELEKVYKELYYILQPHVNLQLPQWEKESMSKTKEI